MKYLKVWGIYPITGEELEWQGLYDYIKINHYGSGKKRFSIYYVYRGKSCLFSFTSCKKCYRWEVRIL